MNDVRYGLKSMNADGLSKHNFIGPKGDKTWSLPKGGEPGLWRGPVEGELEPHHWGFHISPFSHVIDWIWEENYIVEFRGETKSCQDCLVSREARLIQPIQIDDEAWWNLSKQWIKDVIDLPDILGHEASWGNNLRFAYDVVTHPDDHSIRAFQYTQNAIDMIVSRQKDDAACTQQFHHNAIAISHIAQAIKILQDFDSMPAYKAGREVSFHAYQAYEHIIIGIEKYKTATGERQQQVLQDMIESAGLKTYAHNFQEQDVDVPQVHTALRAKQNRELLNALGYDEWDDKIVNHGFNVDRFAL